MFYKKITDYIKTFNNDNIITKKSSIDKNIIIKMYEELTIITTNITNSINNIVININKNIFEKKTTINDGLNFHLQNAIANNTHDKITSYLNVNKNNNISRQAYESRASYFNYEQLKFINDNLLINDKKNIKSIESEKYIDGTNINIYDKSNKNGYRNINILGITGNNNNSFLFTNKIDTNKNSEIKLFYKLIENNPFEKNEIIIVDRYYFSIKFISICIKKQIRFIARLKLNSLLLNKFNDHIKNNHKKINYDPFNYVINFNNKQIRVVSFKTKNEYIHLATTVKNKSVEYFKIKYGSRWNVEIFFKHIKKNSSIDKITSHKIETVNNIIISSSINQLIIDRLISIYNNLNIKKNKCINITTFYDIYSKYLMYKLINNNLSFEEFEKIIILNISFYTQKIDKTISNERYSIKPYTKWHYKYITNIQKNNKQNDDIT